MNNLRILNQELTRRRTLDTYSSELYPSRYKTKRGRHVRLFSDPPPHTLPTQMMQVGVLLLLFFLNVYVNGIERGEWRPFYSLKGRFPTSLSMETLITALERIRENHRLRRTWTGASLGSAGPTWPPLATAFGRVTDRWVLFFDICGPGSCMWVFSDEWALLVSVMQDWISMHLHCVLCIFLSYSTHGCLQIKNHQKLVELVRFKPYNYVR